MGEERWKVTVNMYTLGAGLSTNMVSNSIMKRQRFGECRHVLFSEVASGSEKLRFTASK